MLTLFERVSQLERENAALKAQLAAKTAECEALRQDAERYKFTRTSRMWCFDHRHLEGFELDAAIDAAKEKL